MSLQPSWGESFTSFPRFTLATALNFVPLQTCGSSNGVLNTLFCSVVVVVVKIHSLAIGLSLNCHMIFQCDDISIYRISITLLWSALITSFITEDALADVSAAAGGTWPGSLAFCWLPPWSRALARSGRAALLHTESFSPGPMAGPLGGECRCVSRGVTAVCGSEQLPGPPAPGAPCRTATIVAPGRPP